jgi:aromatic ring-opening dioxygenase catalytic subunit (LigB family)
MGQIVGAFATSHSPGISGFPDLVEARQAERIHAALAELRRRLEAVRPDAIVAVSNEHFTSFFLNNYPAFCIGIADSYLGPASAEMASFLKVAQRTYPGQAELGRALLRELLRAGFDPAFSAGDLAFDENFCVPFRFLMPEPAVPVVPVIVNTVEPPFPPLWRCYALGKALGRAIERQAVAERVVVLATGGLSHSVGTPRAGEIDTGFDQRVLEALSRGEAERLGNWTDEEVEAAGNGAHELRSWLIGAGSVHGRRFEVLAYEVTPAWLTGTAVASAIM